MKSHHYLGVAIFFIILSCGTRQIQVVIPLPHSIQKAIEEAAPAGQYRFYAVKTTCPKNIEELNRSKLFICGEVEDGVDSKLMQCTFQELGKPLFKSVHRYVIRPNLLSGKIVFSENISIDLNDGSTMPYPRENLLFAQDTFVDSLIDSLISNCIKDMQKGNGSVLLISKDVRNEALDKLIKISFHKREK